jgi:hypothetical protein
MHKTALFTLLALLTPLTATAVPTQVNHAGYLTDGTGTPTDGMRTITFGIYENKKFGTPFWTETHEVDVGHGYYAVVLGEIEPLDGDLFLGDTLYLEVDTGGFRPGDRAPMVSTPYAFRADQATSLSGGPVDATEIWVDGSPVIDIDGNWVGGTMMVDWTDLTGVPADFADGIDDVLTETDVDTMVSDNGYAYDADLFSGDWADLTGIPSDVMDGDGDLLADMSCLDGDIIVWDGLALTWTCDLDADSVLTEAEVVAMVTANGFALTADLATVATSGDYADLTGVPTELADGDDDTIASLSCLTGEVAKWDGLGWVCAGDTDTDSVLTESVVDGFVSDNGFALSADLSDVATSGAWSDLTGVPADADTQLTEVEVDAFADNNGYAQSSDIFGGTWSDIVGIPADIADGDDDTLGGLSCINGQVPMFYAATAQWVCDTPSDTTLTEAEVDNFANNNGYALSSDLATVATTGDWYDLVNVPADLTDGNLLADISCLDGEILVWDGFALAWGCGLDQDSVLTEAEVDAMVADNGYITDADAFSGDWNDLINVPVDIDDGDADTLADISCSATQVAKWNGANWACADDTVLDEADVDAFVSDNGFASASDIFSGAFSDLTGVPADADTVGSLTCAANQVPVFNGGSWVCGVDEGTLGRLTCLDGQVPVFDGLGWTCGNSEVTAEDLAALVARIETLEMTKIYYGSYNVSSSGDLAELTGYTEVTGDLTIESNLPSLAGLESLTKVGGALTVTDNSALTSLEGLNNLSSVDGRVYINNNDSLLSLEGLNSLHSADYININQNNSLTSLAGFDSLSSLDGYITIYSNGALTSLNGLNNLTSISEHLEISDNSILTSLEGLDNLSSIGHALTINNNAALTSIASLDSLTSIGLRIEIRDNPVLCKSIVDAFVTMVESFGWSDTLYDTGNKNGC